MSFWKFMISFFVVNILADFTYLKFEFFRYRFFLNNEFQWSSLFIFILEILIFAVLLFAVYNLLEFLEKWRMEQKYIKAQKSRDEEKG